MDHNNNANKPRLKNPNNPADDRLPGVYPNGDERKITYLGNIRGLSSSSESAAPEGGEEPVATNPHGLFGGSGGGAAESAAAVAASPADHAESEGQSADESTKSGYKAK